MIGPLRLNLRTLTLLFASTSFATGLLAQSTELPDIPSAARDAYRQGLDAQSRQELDVALERFQFALKQDAKCLDCMEAIANVQQAMGNDKAALSTASHMASSASTPKSKARADALTGHIYYDEYFAYSNGEGAFDQNPGKAQEALRRAETALNRAVQEDPTNEALAMLHAHLLAALKRDSEASAAFTACASMPGISPTECARAVRFSKNVDLARNEPAPPFQATTLDGKSVSLDSLSGKIVLLDFWGTWCPVCRRDSDYVQSLRDSFPTDRFVLLEIDSGDTHAALMHYLDENPLEGTQIQDDTNQLQTLFHVGVYPTYVILDADGSIRMRERGAIGDLRGEIRKLLAESSSSSSTVATAHP
ncbi:MAG TPA: TlpA disulfide reductase family protein [Candidatus Aquilonibacter sp.]|nr:TlpA disulfide reductase family protein [Candidatus Aquilonibacter sp.]